MDAPAQSSDSPALQAAREGAFLQYVPPAFAGVPDRLLTPAGRPFGPMLVKLTPWRHHLLRGYRSPYVMGGRCRVAHLLQALYLCSPAYHSGSRLAFAWYRARWAWWAVRHFQSASDAFSAWLDAPFELAPAIPREVSRDAPDGRPLADAHWLADRMLLGRSLGLSPVETLHTPYAVIWAMLGHMVGGSHPDRPRFHKERDRQIRAYIKAKRSRGQ